MTTGGAATDGLSPHEHRAQLRLVGFKLRGPFPDALLERLIEMTQFAFGFLGGGDVVSHADKADMLARRIPARL